MKKSLRFATFFIKISLNRTYFLDILMKINKIDELRHFSRKLIRELGILELSNSRSKKTPPHWHSLIEISKTPDITISKLSHLLLLSTSATSRIVNFLVKDKLVTFKDGLDKREKYLSLTKAGEKELEEIDSFSNEKILGAFEFLNEVSQHEIIAAIQKYSEALEKSRLQKEQVKILTLPTSRTVRKQIMQMIANIQKNEFSIPVPKDINISILKAEEEFYFNNSYNFWYAIDANGIVIGSIGLKKIDPNNAELKKFFVRQDYRGKRIAQKLMQSLLKSASKHGFKHIYLGTVDEFQAAHRFYEKSGFKKIPKSQMPVGFDFCPVDTVFFKGEVPLLEAV